MCVILCEHAGAAGSVRREKADAAMRRLRADPQVGSTVAKTPPPHTHVFSLTTSPLKSGINKLFFFN